jgi:dTDP-4-dehydrorhamnose 3,5-epimerase
LEERIKMNFKVSKTPIDNVLIVIPEIFEDHRGFFSEVYRKDKFNECGLPSQFVQFNHSGSPKNVLRGLHFQWDPPMGKLMRVTFGRAFLIAVDIRKGSPTFGQWFGTIASAKNRFQIWAPSGFARGFCVLSDFAEIQYLCTEVYNRNGESSILWDDPDIKIDWPVENPILSAKDKNAETLRQWLQRDESDNFRYIQRR